MLERRRSGPFRRFRQSAVMRIARSDGVDPLDLELFLAEWVLRRISPSDVVQRAISALEAGCDHYSIAVVAGITATHPTTDAVEPELDRLLRDMGRVRPSRDVAAKLLVDECARRIADGRTEPIAGAWEMVDFSINVDESVEFLEQVRRFVDLVCDWDNAGRPEPSPGGDIVAEARAFLARGGLASLPADRR